jgi:DNA-binding MarR family transcriptional regulator
MNVDSQYSEQLNKKHFDFLHCVYKATDLNIYSRNISLAYIAKSINLPESEIISISQYLSTQDFIKIGDDNSFPLRDEIDDCVSITPKGIAEVEKQVTQNLSDSTERLLRSIPNVENVDIEVEKQKIKRYQVLDCIYKATKDDTDQYIRLGYITKDIGLPENQVISITNYLIYQGFLGSRFDLDSPNYAVYITFEGIAEVEKIASRNKPNNQVDQALNVPLNPPFIDETRLQELKDISSKPSNFDFSKLIKLCEELNSNYSQGNYYATAMLTRAIMDHVPPIFGKNSFTEVANNYSGGESFKKIMKNLNDFQKNISHGILHEQIRDRESLPNATQVNCSQALDKLLGEIARILKKSES